MIRIGAMVKRGKEGKDQREERRTEINCAAVCSHVLSHV